MQTTYDNSTNKLDLTKKEFNCTEKNQNRRVVRQTILKRSQVLGEISGLEASKLHCVAMEALGDAHFLGCKIEAISLPVNLPPPLWMKDYVFNNKTNAKERIERPIRYSFRVRSFNSSEWVFDTNSSDSLRF